MPKICEQPGCTNYVFGGGYCTGHQYKRRKAKPIAKFSEKRKKVNAVYYKMARIFKKQYPVCAINSPHCKGITQGVHHTRGRGKYLLVIETWLPACNPCNDYIEAHDAWAREKGFKKSKYY